MRSVRPPPKVVPPKPPQYLFEPHENDNKTPINKNILPNQVKFDPNQNLNNTTNDIYIPSSNNNNIIKEDFEDDVRQQMIQLENEMKELLLQEQQLKASQNDIYKPLMDQYNQFPLDNNVINDKQFNKDKEMEKYLVAPARRKGGAITNLYQDEDDMKLKSARQVDYNEQLQKQVITNYIIYS